MKPIILKKDKEQFLTELDSGLINEEYIYLIEETNEVYTHGRFYRRYEWKEIGEPPVTGEHAQTLDVVFANKLTNKLKIDGDWSIEKYPADVWEPIGIVVIPGEHGVLKDGTGTKNQCGIMSLVPMSYNTPEVGATSEGSMYWGGRGTEIIGKSDGLDRYDSISDGLINYQKVACDTSPSNKSTQLSRSISAFLPRQISTGERPRWNSSASTYGYAPSPYANDDLMSGAYNEAYGTTSFDEDEPNKNVLADFKGIINTKIITDLSDSWKEGAISNSGDIAGVYPAACCCARFKTTGTKAFKDCTIEELRKGIGIWYLPAAGELGYIIPRLYDINDTILKLIRAYIVGAQLDTSAPYLSSSECSPYQAWALDTGLAEMVNLTKGGNYHVRAFMRL